MRAPRRPARSKGGSSLKSTSARAGVITEAMRIVAAKESRDPEQIREAVACGRLAIPANIHHASLSPEGVGTCVDGTGCARR